MNCEWKCYIDPAAKNPFPSLRLGQSAMISNPPQPRAYHSAIIIGRLVYVFGGHTSRIISNQRRLLDDLCVLDLETMQWLDVTTTGDQPCELRAMSLCSIWDGRALLLYGGFDRQWMPRNEVYVLHLDRLKWELMQVTSSFTHKGETRSLPKSAGVATVSLPRFRGGSVMFIGGNQGNLRSNAVHTLSVRKTPFLWRREYTVGAELPLLSTATACAVNRFSKYHYTSDYDVVLFGGWDGRISFNHTYVLNIERMEWRKLNPTGRIPSCRVGHSLVNFYGKFLVLGGHDELTNTMDNTIYALDVEREEWKVVEAVDGEHTRIKIKGHTAVMDKNRMIVFGGHNGVQFTNHMHIVEFGTLHHSLHKMWASVNASTTNKEMESV